MDDLKRQNSHLEAQIRALERAKSLGNFSSVADILNESGLVRKRSSNTHTYIVPNDFKTTLLKEEFSLKPNQHGK